MIFFHIVYNLNKIILNKKNFVLTSYFHNGTAFNFFEILSTLARYTVSGFYLHIKTGNYVKHLSITFQNLVFFLHFSHL